LGGASEYDVQNMQARKEVFQDEARNKRSADYLQSTRIVPLSPFEIKAGWEIPAVLEQGLNSDLPGELKALVTSNVYDTGTGLHLLIPQGSRLVGKYDSRVSYGQDGVQVAWDRIIFPDASSVNLNGMVGLDAQGNSGLRDQVDRLDLSRFLRQTVKSQKPANGELTHGTVSTEVHEGSKSGGHSAAGCGGIGRRGGSRV
jgi:type IV secretion system protein VirB10